MTAFALITGALYRDPEQRTSKSGRPFVTATLKVRDGEALAWWKVTTFSERSMAELSRLKEGEALAAQGELKIQTYEKDGEKRFSLCMVADSVLPLRRPREKAAGERNEPRRHQGSAQPQTHPSDSRSPATGRQRSPGGMSHYGGSPDPDLNDAVPW